MFGAGLPVGREIKTHQMVRLQTPTVLPRKQTPIQATESVYGKGALEETIDILRSYPSMAKNREVLFTRTEQGMRVTVETVHQPPRRFWRGIRRITFYGNLIWLAYDRGSFFEFYERWLVSIWQVLQGLTENIVGVLLRGVSSDLS